MAGLNALTTEGYVQAKDRLQPWNSKGWRPEGLVEAAARDLEGFKSLKVLSVWSLAKECPNGGF